MESLSCYSLYGDKLAKGIKVDDFETIIVNDPSTEVIMQATLQTASMLDPAARKDCSSDFRQAGGFGLTFIKEAPKNIPVVKSGILLAVNPNHWHPAADNLPAVLVDPCGPKGHVILFVRALSPCVLTPVKPGPNILAVTKEGKPVLRPVNRASLMLAALSNPNNAVRSPVRCLEKAL